MNRERFTPPDAIKEQEDKDVVMHNVDIMTSEEFGFNTNQESIGGNTGGDQSTTNTYVNRTTGKIMGVGNPQHLGEEITENPQNTLVRFLVDHWYGIGQARALLQREEYTPSAFPLIQAVYPYREALTPQAINTLEQSAVIAAEVYRDRTDQVLNKLRRNLQNGIKPETTRQ